MSGHHARLGLAPSSLDRTVACNAWVEMSEGLPPEPDKPETLEGNAADWVAKQYAKGVEVPFGTDTPIKGYKVDYDMIHGAKLWADVVGYGAVSGVPVIIERVHPECWGEPDGWRHDAIAETLRVPDYKYGFGIIEAFENQQTIAYAVGLLDMLGLDDQRTKVVITIVQPRAFHPRGPVRTWEVMGDQLRAHANVLSNAARSALRKKGEILWNKPLEAVAGPHCMSTHCPARFRCPTLQRAAGHVAEWMRQSESPIELTPDAIGAELTILNAAAEVIAARQTGLAAQAEALIRSSKRIPGFKMEQAPTRLAWKPDAPVSAIDAMAKALGKALRKPEEAKNVFVTPTQAIKAGADETLVELYSARPPGAMRLAVDDGTEARRVFGAVAS